MTKITTRPLIYDDFLTLRYRAYRDLPDFVLLQSSDRQRGRYDILSACPRQHIRLHRDNCYGISLTELLGDIIGETAAALDLPFQGGGIGYVAYDFAAIQAGLHAPPIPGMEGLAVVDFGVYDWAVIADHRLKRVTLVADHQSTDINALIQRWENPILPEGGVACTTPLEPMLSRASCEAGFDAVRAALIAGRTYQVNHTQPFQTTVCGDVFTLFTQVMRQNPVPFGAFLARDEGYILSFSPERLLLHHQGTLRTTPIKGTVKRDPDPAKDHELLMWLQQSPKNRAENVMIVDLLRNDLGKWAVPGSVRVEVLCEVQSYAGVHHLESTIQAICPDDVSPLRVLDACFPGGSVTGAPKREAMRVIQEIEPWARGVYCGSIGYVSRCGRFDMNIAIRTATLCENRLILPAGGGLVIDSAFGDEYREAFAKIQVIQRHLDSICI